MSNIDDIKNLIWKQDMEVHKRIQEREHIRLEGNMYHNLLSLGRISLEDYVEYLKDPNCKPEILDNDK